MRSPPLCCLYGERLLAISIFLLKYFRSLFLTPQKEPDRIFFKTRTKSQSWAGLGVAWFPNPLAAGSQMGTLSRLGDTRMIYSQLTYPNINFSVLGHFQLTTTLHISTYLCWNTKYIYAKCCKWMLKVSCGSILDRSVVVRCSSWPCPSHTRPATQGGFPDPGEAEKGSRWWCGASRSCKRRQRTTPLLP